MSSRCGYVRREVATNVSGIVLSCFGAEAFAFPPYHTTDAETAGRDAIEWRLGLLEVERTDSVSERLAPLSHLNFGLGDHYEISSELEYSPDDGRLHDGALGFKWAGTQDPLSFGVETLALLPVQSNQSGSGIESQFLATLRRDLWRMHVNAGLSHDARGEEVEKGWRGSVLVELPRERMTPGFELFATEKRGENTKLQAGFGIIASFERIELRTGLHVGLNDAAPDLEASVWLSWKWQLERDR